MQQCAQASHLPGTPEDAKPQSLKQGYHQHQASQWIGRGELLCLSDALPAGLGGAGLKEPFKSSRLCSFCAVNMCALAHIQQDHSSDLICNNASLDGSTWIFDLQSSFLKVGNSQNASLRIHMGQISMWLQGSIDADFSSGSSCLLNFTSNLHKNGRSRVMDVSPGIPAWHDPTLGSQASLDIGASELSSAPFEASKLHMITA